MENSKSAQKLFHYFSFNLIKVIINDESSEKQFYYRSPKTLDFKKFPVRSVSNFFAVDVKNSKVASSKNISHIKEFLYAQEWLVNNSHFEETIMRFVKEFNKNKSFPLSNKDILEAILFAYWRARRVSYDYNSFQKDNLINFEGVPSGLVRGTDLVDEQINLTYIIDFCTFTFKWFGFKYVREIKNYRRKASEVHTEQSKRDKVISKSKFEDIGIKNIKFRNKSGSSNRRHLVATEDEHNIISNIKSILEFNFNKVLVKSNNEFPIIAEPYGVVFNDSKRENDFTILKNNNHLVNSYTYLQLNRNEIILFIPDSLKVNDDVVRFIISCIYLDVDVPMMYTKKSEILDKLSSIFKQLDFSSETKSAWELYENFFDEIDKLFLLEWNEIS